MQRLDYTDEALAAKHGRGIIMNLSILARLTEIYDSRNDSVMAAAGRLLGSMAPLMRVGGDLTVRLSEKSFFIEDSRVKATAADMDTFGSLIMALEARGVGSLSFSAGLGAEDLVDALYGLMRSADQAEAEAAMEAGGTCVGVGAAEAVARGGEFDMRDTRLVARKAYAQAVSALMEVFGCVRTGQKPGVRQAKRAVQCLIDCIGREERYVLGLSAPRDPQGYLYAHSVRVTVLSVAMGRRLGLGRHDLCRLGMAALMHDIGKATLPEAILVKQSELEGHEMAVLMEHPARGVQGVLASRGMNDVSMLSVLVCFEHHMNLEPTGYPATEGRWRPCLMSRIVRIANEFDNLVSGVLYGHEPLGPEETLSTMAGKSGTAFDPTLLKVLGGLVGTP